MEFGFSGMLLLSAKISKTSWQTGKLRTKEDLENDSLVHRWNTSQIPRETARIHRFGKKVPPGIFQGHALVAEGNLGRRYSDC